MIAAGLAVGVISVVLVALGNPANMGFCIACFLRDIAGAVGLHRAEPVQYIRPEIIGLVLGAMGMALIGREFKVRGGSAPLSRFGLGFAVMVGALMFLGCPLRMVLRLGGGDLNALVGLLGFAAGIFGGTLLLKAGFSLKKSQPQTKVEG
ncbi:MAG: YedE family putative selenium transporter, partial [Pseudoflavonifractor sp.]